MAIGNLVTSNNLGNEFDVGVTDPGTVRVKIDGTSIQRAADGTLSAVTSASLNVTTEPTYEYRDLWAEESAQFSSTTANGNQWSYGNGAAGIIGIPFGDGWEVLEMGFQSDVNGANNGVTVDLVDIQNGSGTNTVAQMIMTNAGNGQANNAHWIQVFDPPVVVPAGAVLGFRSVAETGDVRDVRASARFRRQVGTVVTGVTLT